MRILNLEGDYFQIGKKLGKIYKDHNMDINGVKIDAKLFKNQLKVYEKHYPELIEELKGVAAGANFNEDKTIYDFITAELRYAQSQLLKKGCTIFGVKNKNGFFIGRNYDWYPLVEKHFTVCKYENPKANNFIGISDMAIISNNMPVSYMFHDTCDIINDKGLFVGMTFAFNDKWSYGISCFHLVKLIAETCSTVKDVVDLFEKVPLCYPKNFFIADKKGDMVVIEHDSKEFKLTYPEDGVLIKTNHYLDSELKKEDLVLKQSPINTTFVRYYGTLRQINKRKDKFKFFDILKILKDTKYDVYQDYPKMKTVWTLALDMSTQNYKIYWNLHEKKKEKSLNI